MVILNIIDSLYESKYFPTILLVSIIVLVVLFVAVIILGKKDAKKSLEPKKENVLELKDITFTNITESESIKEDVTFEIPVLTKNLENFKKSLEEEIEREEKINVIKKTSDTKKEAKPVKIFDKEKIDNTDILPIIDIDKEDILVEEVKNEEIVQPPKREILKELFRDKKNKIVEPPKLITDDSNVKNEVNDTNKNILIKEESKTIVNKTNDQNQLPRIAETKKKLDIDKVLEKNRPVKIEHKYSGDDDF